MRPAPFLVSERNVQKRPLAIPPGTGHVKAVLPVNSFRHINTFFVQVNRALAPGGLFSLHFTPSEARYRAIMEGFPPPLNKVFFVVDYFWSRWFVKLPVLRTLYFGCWRGCHRALPRAEVLGRLYRAGFAVRKERSAHKICRVVCQKVREPITDDKPSYGPVCALLRVGYGGKLIRVYKFRTMHAYAEYIQDYVYAQNGLQEGGKLKNDYRVNAPGKYLRRFFIDELPMLLNMLKGECKLVGVRPLSRSYFKLYTPRMQAERITVKPGLIPPFYADVQSPRSLDEVQESEHRYIAQYRLHPLATDWKYFWRGLHNVVIRRRRSQ